VLGKNHPITRYLTQTTAPASIDTSTSHPMPAGGAAADNPERPL
jgi:hypothetical protein